MYMWNVDHIDQTSDIINLVWNCLSLTRFKCQVILFIYPTFLSLATYSKQPDKLINW